MKITQDDGYAVTPDTLELDGRPSPAATDRPRAVRAPSRRLAGDRSHGRPTAGAAGAIAADSRSPKAR
jgi:hypothetical protein